MPDNNTPLGEAQDWLRTKAMNGGARCPCCSQFAKVYRRRMTSTTGRVMLTLAREHGTKLTRMPVLMRDYLPDVAHQGGYATLAQHWGFLAEGTEAGYWRLTMAGMRFAKGETTAPTYVHLFDGRRLATSGPYVDIYAVLGSKFDYAELMSA